MLQLSVMPRAHIFYRTGQSWQALKEKTKAVSASKKDSWFKAGLAKKQKTDAEEQLAALKT